MPMLETGRLVDPFPTYAFFVEIDGIVLGAFSECSGLEIEMDVEEYEEGGLNNCVHKLPGRVKYGDLTLRYGTAGSEGLWAWYQTACQGAITRKNISIVLFNPAGTEVRRWNFVGAYPINWTGPEFGAEDDQVAIESLVIAHMGMV